MKEICIILIPAKVLSGVKECLATAEQMQGVCRMVERRERCQLSLLPSLSSNDYHCTMLTAGNSRCVVERLSPCLSSTLIGRLVGDYRAVWRWSYLTVIVIIGFFIITIIAIIIRWELEERYKETADKGRVSFLLIISAKTELMISILFYFNRLL